jgi:hypothetical protein
MRLPSLDRLNQFVRGACLRGARDERKRMVQVLHGGETGGHRYRISRESPALRYRRLLLLCVEHASRKREGSAPVACDEIILLASDVMGAVNAGFSAIRPAPLGIGSSTIAVGEAARPSDLLNGALRIIKSPGRPRSRPSTALSLEGHRLRFGGRAPDRRVPQSI